MKKTKTFNMKKTIVCFVALCLLLVTFCSCKQDKEPELLSGSYLLSENESVHMSPLIKFDTEKSTFTFHYDYLSAYYAYGKITVKGNQVIAETDDGKYTYIFEIRSDNKIVFVQNGSSEIVTTDKNALQIIDGTEFILKKQ